MGTLIFDIETVGETWADYDTLTRKSLTRWIDKTARTEEEYAVLLSDLKAGLGFSPLTGSIVAIGLYDLEREQGAVYYVGEGTEEDEVYDAYVLKQRTETEMLKEFWDGAQSYDTFVSFNGRQFDVPFLHHRSAIHAIRPTQNLMEGRYPSQQKNVRHVDLQDALTFYGAMQRRGNLHLFCRAYGIPSPKSEDVSGDEVARLFKAKQYRDIARYNVADVVATTALYERYRKYFAGIS